MLILFLFFVVDPMYFADKHLHREDVLDHWHLVDLFVLHHHVQLYQIRHVLDAQVPRGVHPKTLDQE